MGQTVKDYVLGIIGFTFLIVGSLVIIGSMYQLNPSGADAASIHEFDMTFNKTNDLLTSVDSMKSSITSSEADPGPFGMLNALISTAWNALKTIFTSFGFMLTAIGGLSKSMFGIPIPAWATSLAVAAVVVILVFAIYRAIFQSE
jgi:hypothetical protein